MRTLVVMGVRYRSSLRRVIIELGEAKESAKDGRL